jgi:hypothetical protein
MIRMRLSLQEFYRKTASLKWKDAEKSEGREEPQSAMAILFNDVYGAGVNRFYAW